MAIYKNGQRKSTPFSLKHLKITVGYSMLTPGYNDMTLLVLPTYSCRILWSIVFVQHFIFKNKPKSLPFFLILLRLGE